MPVTISGSTGVTTPGVDSTGMPTSGGDPIVESGSNSDGGWIRWADGTQMCRNTFTATLDIDVATSSGVYQSRSNTRSFPLPFLTSEYGIGWVPDERVFCPMGAQDSIDSGAMHDFRVGGLNGAALSQVVTIKYVASGRWK